MQSYEIFTNKFYIWVVCKCFKKASGRLFNSMFNADVSKSFTSLDKLSTTLQWDRAFSKRQAFCERVQNDLKLCA